MKLTENLRRIFAERMDPMNASGNIDTSALVIPISDTLLLPGVQTVITVPSLGEAELRQLRDGSAVSIALSLKQNFAKRELKAEDFHRIGVSFKVDGIEKTDGGYLLRLTVAERVEIKALRIEAGMVRADYEACPLDTDITEKSQEELLDYVKRITHEVGAKFRGAEQYTKILDEIQDLNAFIVYLAQFMPISNEDKYELLEAQSIRARGLKFLDYLIKLKETVELQMELQEKFSTKANKSYRESVLREQLKAIQEELGEGKSEEARGASDYARKIEDAKMPEEAKKVALEELDKLQAQGPNSPDYNIIRNYLDLLVQLPWTTKEAGPVNLGEARRILDAQHYGLGKVKDRIVQHLAVMRLKKDKKGSILLLVGPPGTGKTSLGKSIAEALGRKYVRLSLGGIRDESEIRGHRRTYVGAMPGRIIQSMKKIGEMNPVMVLDEVDKLLTGGYSGDPASALLEVLDPEQNNSFTDHYLDLPYDLSGVLFIATANSLESIPPPLLDRMEIIQISSYTSQEKFHIGRNHLVPAVLEEHGLSPDQLVINDEVLRRLIADFTSEAGVRGLKQHLASLARITSEKIVSAKVELPYEIKPEELEDLLGRQVSRHDKVQAENPPGVVTGLAWTPVGGEILFIEATDMPGKGEVILTGKLGDVMKESAQISLSLLKSRLPMDSISFKDRDLHIHVPSGSVPKDGPSAGIALFTALASLVTGVRVDSRLAMTGEITLRGNVLPIGGLKEKLLGALRAGISKVLVPKDNMADLKDVPEEVRKELTIIPMETVEDVLRETLGIALPRIEHVLNLKSFGQGTRVAKPAN